MKRGQRIYDRSPEAYSSVVEPGESRLDDPEYYFLRIHDQDEMLVPNRELTNELPKKVRAAIYFNKANVTYNEWLVYELGYLSGETALMNSVIKQGKIGLSFSLLVFKAQTYIFSNTQQAVDGKLGDDTLNAMKKWSLGAINYNLKHCSFDDYLKWVRPTLIKMCGDKDLNYVNKNKTISSKEFAWLVLQGQRLMFPENGKLHTGKLDEKTMKGIRIIRDHLQQQELNDVIHEYQNNPEFQFSGTNVPQPAKSGNATAREEANADKQQEVSNTRDFERHFVVWNTDKFAVRLAITESHFVKEKSKYLMYMNVTITYLGSEDVSADSVSVLHSFYSSYPSVYPLVEVINDPKGNENSLFIDLLHDGSNFLMLKEGVILNKAWTPPWRIHEFVLVDLIREQPRPMNNIVVKPKDALPSNLPAVVSETITGIEGLSHNEALIAAIISYNQIVENTRIYEIYPQHPLFGKLGEQLRLEQIYTERAESEGKPYNHAMQLSATRNMIEHIKYKLQATAFMSAESAFPKSIGEKAAKEVNLVRSAYCKAALDTYYDIDTGNAQLHRADQQMALLPFRLNNLYLEKDKGFDEQISGIRTLSYQINGFRHAGHLSADFTHLEQSIGLRNQTSYGHFTLELANLRIASENGVATYQQNMALANRINQSSGLAYMLMIYELFRMYDYQINSGFNPIFDNILPNQSAHDAARDYIIPLKRMLYKIDHAVQMYDKHPGSQQAQHLEQVVSNSLAEFYSMANTSTFNLTQEYITDRLQNIETIKGIVIIIVAALASMGVGALVGVGLSAIGVSGAALTGGIFVAEVASFTLVEKSLSNDWDGSFWKDLAENAAVFAVLRGIGKLHGKVMAKIQVTEKLPLLFKASQAGTSLISLQALGEVQYYAETGDMMNWDQRYINIFQNVVLMSFMSLGEMMARPLHTRIGENLNRQMHEKFLKEMEAIESNRHEVNLYVRELKNKKNLTPEEIMEFGKKLEQQFNSEYTLLELAKEQGLDAKLIEAQLQFYRQQIIELEMQLAHSGLEIQLGVTKHFQVVAPGIIAYESNQASAIRKFFGNKEKEGVKLEELRDGVFVVEAGQEKVLYVPREVKKQITTWNEIQQISNKYPDEPITEGVLWGVATIQDGKIMPIEGKGDTFQLIDFVVTNQGELKLGQKHHFLGNKENVEAAGTLKIVKGKIKTITNFSGHYEPTIEESLKYVEVFKQLKLDLKGVAIEIIYVLPNGEKTKMTKFIN